MLIIKKLHFYVWPNKSIITNKPDWRTDQRKVLTDNKINNKALKQFNMSTCSFRDPNTEPEHCFAITDTQLRYKTYLFTL